MWEDDQADEGTEVFDEEVETNPGKRLLWEAEHGELNAVQITLRCVVYFPSLLSVKGFPRLSYKSYYVVRFMETHLTHVNS